MAIRPVYIPGPYDNFLVVPVEIEFQWFSGLSITQKRKSIQSLHAAAAQQNITKVLEISSKSSNDLGVKLSAFNLQFFLNDGRHISIENVFQGSKVFENGGPYLDLFEVSPKEAKTDQRLRASGSLRGFSLEGTNWPLQPATVFYDWLYLSALKNAPDIASRLMGFDGFSDIEFNPARSLNCQAASAALFVSLVKRGEFYAVMQDQQSFINRLRESNH